jgi:hypothetical protein
MSGFRVSGVTDVLRTLKCNAQRGMGAGSTFTSETTGCLCVPSFQYCAVTFSRCGGYMTTKAQAIPKGYHTVTPSLVVAGAAKALDFYTTSPPKRPGARRAADGRSCVP